MKLKISFFLTVAFVGALFAVTANPLHVAAQTEEGLIPEHIVLDGQEFKRNQLIQAFFSSAFTKDILNENGGRVRFHFPESPDEDRYFLGEKNLRENYPWLYPQIYTQKLPRLLTVNKWVQPIRISFGMPNDLGPLHKEKGYSAYFHLGNAKDVEISSFREGDDFKLLEEQVSRFAKEIKPLINIDIEYLLNGQENEEYYGNVRINFVSLDRSSLDASRNDYKTRGGALERLGFIRAYNYRGLEQEYLKNGFVFTASSSKQVDGYILSNGNNEIEMAVCYIWVGHELEMMKSLVNECILRSLGFPGFVYPDGLKDGPVVSSYIAPWNDPDSLINYPEGKVRLPSDLSEFDRFMIQTLYKPEIKPGMDYVGVHKVLSKPN